jgi:hypothetical protein
MMTVPATNLTRVSSGSSIVTKLSCVVCNNIRVILYIILDGKVSLFDVRDILGFGSFVSSGDRHYTEILIYDRILVTTVQFEFGNLRIFF